MRRLLPLAVGLALLAGLWLLPDLAERPEVPDSGQERARGIVVDADAGTDAAGQPQLTVRLTEGDRAGEEVVAVIQQPGMALPGAKPPGYETGDEVVVSVFEGAAGGFVTVDEPWRIPLLAWLAAGFAAAVLLVGGLRGARSLVALAFTLLVVGKVLIPLLLAGWPPLPLAIGAAAGVTVVTLLPPKGRGARRWPRSSVRQGRWPSPPCLPTSRPRRRASPPSRGARRSASSSCSSGRRSTWVGCCWPPRSSARSACSTT
jgi:hypothetical protein